MLQIETLFQELSLYPSEHAIGLPGTPGNSYAPALPACDLDLLPLCLPR